MARKSLCMGLFTALLLAAGFAPRAAAQDPSAAQMLRYRPKMPGVSYTIPSEQETLQCRVKTIRSNDTGRSVGWEVIDGRGQLLRRFFDSNGDNKIDIWSYYKDGTEVYREIDTKAKERPDQFRWINDGGMKWGVDHTGSGRIDQWQMISAEEIGQEVFQALLTNDFARLIPLFITEDDMAKMRMSARDVGRVKNQLARAQNKFKATVAQLKLSAGQRFKHVESAAPSCKPGDGNGADLIHYPSRAILYEVAQGQIGVVQSGEMIQVGQTWRLADAPGENSGSDPITPPLVQKALKDITDFDKLSTPVELIAQAKHMAQRADLVERLLAVMATQDSSREDWYKQLLDNLYTAAPYVKTSMNRLGDLRTQMERAMPGSNIAGYAAYREICALYLPELGKGHPPTVMRRWQEKFHDALAKFVQVYPRVDDTPDALQYLAVGAEFAGKDAEAVRWYEQIYKNFATHRLAEGASGSVRRLQCVGQTFELTGPRLDNGTVFSIGQLKGKVVAVYYWGASYCDRRQQEFAVLKQVHAANAIKGFEVVCVNVDDQQATAVNELAKLPAVGIHLYQQGKGSGLNSPLATHYGINVLPTIFLIDRNGKVVNRTLQMADLEEAVRKAL